MLQSETRWAVREQSAAQFVDDQVGIVSQQIEGGQTVRGGDAEGHMSGTGAVAAAMIGLGTCVL